MVLVSLRFPATTIGTSILNIHCMCLDDGIRNSLSINIIFPCSTKEACVTFKVGAAASDLVNLFPSHCSPTDGEEKW